MIVLSNRTAFDIYTSKQGAELVDSECACVNLAKQIQTSNDELDALLNGTISLPKPIDIAVIEPAKRIRKQGFNCSLISSDLPARSIYSLGGNLAIVSPALLFAKICSHIDFIESIYLGARLCSSYYVDRDELSLLAHRDPLTSAEAISRQLQSMANVRGAKIARARCAHIPLGHAASPPEIALAMLLTLPKKYGGAGLSGGVLNKRVDSDGRRSSFSSKQYRVGDIVFEKERVIVEYDSDSMHLNSDALAEDAKRRLELENSGWRVITVTRKQLYNQEESLCMMRAIERGLGKKARADADWYCERQADLHRRLCTMLRAEGKCQDWSSRVLMEAALDSKSDKK